MLPKIIYSYWHQGREAAPPLVRTCMERIEALNPEWRVRILDEDSAEEAVRRIPLSSEKWSRLSLPHRSDLIRTRLLIDTGGVWIDPTVYLTQPLDEWIHARMEAGIFLFSRPGRDRVISNWFIAAEPSNILLSRLLESLCDYWESNDFRRSDGRTKALQNQLSRIINRNLDLPRLWLTWPFRKWFRLSPYMIYHYTFYDLVKSDNGLAEMFSAMPKVPAESVHTLQRYGLHSEFSDVAKAILEDPDLPLQKLAWKLPEGAERPTSVHGFIVRSGDRDSPRTDV
jgi:hypothetical protein